MKTFLLLGVMIGAGVPSFALSYSIPRFTIATGGGSSAGGRYVIQGTAGQAEPGGPRSASPYVILGGFWPGAVSTLSSIAPVLAVELQSDGQVLISWPLSASGFGLNEASGPAGSSNGVQWSAVPLPYRTNADRISVTVPPVGSRFYRLSRP